jgi:hypothetical protein
MVPFIPPAGLCAMSFVLSRIGPSLAVWWLSADAGGRLMRDAALWLRAPAGQRPIWSER